VSNTAFCAWRLRYALHLPRFSYCTPAGKRPLRFLTYFQPESSNTPRFWAAEWEDWLFYIIVPADKAKRELRLPAFLHVGKDFSSGTRGIPKIKDERCGERSEVVLAEQFCANRTLLHLDLGLKSPNSKLTLRVLIRSNSSNWARPD
jgi:hypothetical protein